MLTVLAVRAVAGHGESLCLIEPTRNVPSPHWNANLCYVRSVAGGELCRESNPRVTFHRPLELTLELTGCCARARDFGTAVVCECLHFEPSQTSPPSPR